MDLRRPLHKQSSLNTPRPPLALTEKNNVAQRPRTREVSSRYKSPTPSQSYGGRRSPSPDVTRTMPKRTLSVERKRPSTPPSPSTPVHDSSRKVTGGRLNEGLWPSTMRSLSVSFQSDSISIPVSKKEKPAPAPVTASDRTLRPSSNVAHKQPETPSFLRKPTPERKRSPLKGKNAPDQSENSKPVDGSSTRLIDQHRWPSRTGGKVSSNLLNKSLDLSDRGLVRNTQVSGISWRNSPDGPGKPLQKARSDTARLMSLDGISRAGSDKNSIDGSLRSRPSSPFGRPSLVSRGATPNRSRPSTPPRGISPSRIRPSTSSTLSTSSNSVLTFITDVKKGKKSASYIEDAHQLRLLYNRYVQWRFANTRTESVLHIQKVNAERTLYGVWNTTLGLWDSVIRKRINLKQLKLELKLNSVLNDQMAYLDDWELLERDHVNSLTGCVEDLEASTLRLPVTGGAKTDIDSLKVAICSAVDVMQAMGSSICSLLPMVEEMDILVSELAVLAAQEKTMLDECETLLASASASQVEELSIRTHLVQMKQVLDRRKRMTTMFTELNHIEQKHDDGTNFKEVRVILSPPARLGKVRNISFDEVALKAVNVGKWNRPIGWLQGG
ncbi:hypothetical protein ACFE04_009587 [Oxalis oulophora]